MSRYIDADLMKENHLMSDDCNNCEQNPRECQHNYIYTKMDFCEWIDDEPTADVVERKKGEWKETTESIGWEEVSCAECSVCGGTFVLGDYTMDDIKLGFNYCPNCGTMMEDE